MDDQILTRKANQLDLSQLCSILNEIIAIGGSTAYEDPLTETDIDAHFLTGTDCISCIVAHRGETILGFQALSEHPKLPINWVDIATFARTAPKVKGIGTALFESTKQLLRGTQYTQINARIRADNQSGLAYYTKMGFTDYAITKAVPLKDGTPIDRINKQFGVGPS